MTSLPAGNMPHDWGTFLREQFSPKGIVHEEIFSFLFKVTHGYLREFGKYKKCKQGH